MDQYTSQWQQIKQPGVGKPIMNSKIQQPKKQGHYTADYDGHRNNKQSPLNQLAQYQEMCRVKYFGKIKALHTYEINKL